MNSPFWGYVDANGMAWSEPRNKPKPEPITWLGEVPLDPLTDKPIDYIAEEIRQAAWDYLSNPANNSQNESPNTLSGNAYDHSIKALKADAVNPVHYTTTDGRQVWDVMEQDYLTPEQYQGYLLGNVAKYLHRYAQKNGLEDVEKAKAYFIRYMKFQKDNG